jgi:hypothetical protein
MESTYTENHINISHLYPSEPLTGQSTLLYGSPRKKRMECGRSLVWSRTSACHADDPGSNLGDRTTPSLTHNFPSRVLFVNTCYQEFLGYLGTKIQA